MKKLILIFLVLLIFLNACQTKKEAKTLSEMQIVACDTAHESGTCGTRLAELGIVLKEDCCKSLGKCC